MSSQRLLLSVNVKIILFFCTCLSPWKINRIRLFLNCCTSEWGRQISSRNCFLLILTLKHIRFSRESAHINLQLAERYLSEQKSLWPVLYFPVCLYHGRGSPHQPGKFRKSCEQSWSLTYPPLYPVDGNAVLMLTPAPNSVTSLLEHIYLTVSCLSNINEPVPFGCLFTSMTKSIFFVLGTYQLLSSFSIFNAEGHSWKTEQRIWINYIITLTDFGFQGLLYPFFI